jgi:hypothetical protein
LYEKLKGYEQKKDSAEALDEHSSLPPIANKLRTKVITGYT